MFHKKQIRVNPCNPWLTILCALCVLCGLTFFVGCDQTSAQRIAEVKAVVDKANILNQSVDAGITELQTVAQASQALLLDPNVPESMKPAISQALQTASAKITQLQQQKAKITASLAQWQAILNQTAAEGNDIGLTQEIQTYASMTNVSASYLPAPYNGYVYLGSALAAILAGLIASVIKNLQQSGQINSSKSVLTDLVISVDSLLDPKNAVIPPDKVEAAKIVLQQNQTGSTQDAVDAIHDPMKNTAPTN
ncbi:MAG: hypothetical protein ABSB91_00325 [Sedimentisphaerales bacterium]